MLLRDVRPLVLGDAHAGSTVTSADPVDLRLTDGTITGIGPGLRPSPGEEVLDGHGALAIPGLWDQHVHVGQTAQGYSRLDTSSVGGVGELLALTARALAERAEDRTDDLAAALVGFGHRLVDFAGAPTVAALDAIAPHRPVVLIGGDAHHAWMNTPALRGLGLPAREGVVAEEEWFAAVAHLDDLPGVAAGLEAGVGHLQSDALARGVVGIVDMEWSENWRLWERRAPRLRVRTATYATGLDAVPGPSGTPIGSSGLAEMGPLKAILDGALGSRSAYCRHAYGAHGGDSRGVLSIAPGALDALLSRADALGLDVALHAIGDAAAGVALDALARRPAIARRTRLEHAQMLTDADIEHIAALGVTASVQPAHLLDDRDATEELWGAHVGEAYRLRDLIAAGVPLVLGSDAPVAPIDPWLAMAAAVHRSADARSAWLPAQQLQPREALAASTDGVTGLSVGGRADLVLLDPATDAEAFADVPTGADGLLVDAAARESAARLRAVRPLTTIVAGRLEHSR
ncbi:amidohydrolase [Brachybacterium huguangmaarense]